MNHLKELIKHYIREIISEAPIDNITKVGNWQKSSSFSHKSDRNIINSPHAIQKMYQKWSKTDYHFDIFFVNDKRVNSWEFTEVGEVSEEFVREKMKLTPEELPLRSGDEVITIIYTNNKGSERVSMTPWVMAHRFAHAILATDRKKGTQNYYLNHIVESLKGIMKDFDFTGISRRLAPGFYGVPTNTKDVVNFFYSILKFRSAREMDIRNFYEILFELFAQYIIEGKVELKRPDFIYGHRKVKINLLPHYIEDFHRRLDIIENDINIMFDQMLSSCEGKIYVM
jgi:hypothetical protein